LEKAKVIEPHAHAHCSWCGATELSEMLLTMRYF